VGRTWCFVQRAEGITRGGSIQSSRVASATTSDGGKAVSQ
jgi:hypothetical protein